MYGKFRRSWATAGGWGHAIKYKRDYERHEWPTNKTTVIEY